MPVEIGLFTMIPSKFFSSCTAARIGASASLVYIALCEHANRHEANTFKASDKALASETGLGTRTICDARKRLIESGLISCTRENGQSFVYTIFTQSLEWVPLDQRLRPKRKPRAIYASRAG